MSNMKLACPYPVGAILQLAAAVDPNDQYIGARWERIEDVFLVGAGEIFTLGDEGGGTMFALAAENLPAHAHGLSGHVHSVGAHAHGLNNHVHSVGAHSHGLNGHTHSYAKLSSTGGTTLSVAQLASHGHIRRGYHIVDITQYSGTNRECVSRYTSAGGDTSNSENNGSGNTHNHSVGTTSVNTGGNSGSTANSGAFNSGASSGSTANSSAFDSGASSVATTSTGNGEAFPILPVYEAVYVWERVS